jgi:predicted membrane channel-forming protein YqfA (hemolysin III family)
VTALVAVAIVSVVFAAAGFGAAALIRRRVRQDPRPARLFAALAVALAAVSAVIAVATGTALAAVPTLAVGALCAAAGWAFRPSFTDFERAFHAYVDSHVRHRP